MKTVRIGKRLLLPLAASLLLTGCMESTKMARGTTVLSTPPTMESLQGGKPMLYDDGKCPSGQIAQFTKRGGRTQINRACVARPA